MLNFIGSEKKQDLTIKDENKRFKYNHQTKLLSVIFDQNKHQYQNLVKNIYLFGNSGVGRAYLQDYFF
jgi:predicted ATPase